ncbi:chemotaxis protein CheW [Candidatus Kapaibacterium sp.]
MDISKIYKEKGENCWQESGVFGNGTCEWLDNYYHCKNCPVFALGGRKLLNRELLPELVNEWTNIISLPKDADNLSKKSYFIFKISDEIFGISTNIFLEALVNKAVHYIPGRTNDFLHGVINVNGELHLCFSLSNILKIDSVEMINTNNGLPYFNNLLMVSHDNIRFAFPVSEFYGVNKFDVDLLQSPPQTISKSEETITVLVADYKNQKVAIIDEDKLFNRIKKKMIW